MLIGDMPLLVGQFVAEEQGVHFRTCRGFCITDQITDQYAPYCSELRYAVSSDYIELADYWWIQ